MAPVFNSKKHDAVVFGDFRLCIAERRLTRADGAGAYRQPILGHIDRADHAARGDSSKDDLIALVWPKTHVDESALRVHISGLRKALDDNDSRLITNVPGRGYGFVGPIAATTTPARGIKKIEVVHDVACRFADTGGTDHWPR